MHRRAGRAFDLEAWETFLDWARGYDDPAFTGRSRAAHEEWLAARSQPVLRLDSARDRDELKDLVLARVERLVFGAYDEKAGAVGSLWDVVRDRRLNHRPEVVSGVLAAEASELLDGFFAGHRRSAADSAPVVASDFFDPGRLR